MLSRTFLSKRTRRLKAVLNRFSKRFHKPRIVIHRGGSFRKDKFLRIPVAHSGIRRKDERRN
jgi:hypothetical protein